jgi:predicted lipoprotein with Yx(FWY)xxD motif
MTDSNTQQARRATRRHLPAIALAAVVAALAFAVSLVALASAGTTSVSINSTANSRLKEQIVVNSQGRTLYTLSGETATRLKCKTSECFKFWPPVTVPSRTTKLRLGPGVHGKLAIMHRSNGMLQVTLRGMPLYRFSKDSAKGQANGQGIESFGGTWSAATASAPSTSTPSTGTSTTTMPPSTPPYGY